MRLILLIIGLFFSLALHADCLLSGQQLRAAISEFIYNVEYQLGVSKPHPNVYYLDFTTDSSRCTTVKINYSYYTSDYFFLRFYDKYFICESKIILLKKNSEENICDWSEIFEVKDTIFNDFFLTDQNYLEKKKYEYTLKACCSFEKNMHCVPSRRGECADVIKLVSSPHLEK